MSDPAFATLARVRQELQAIAARDAAAPELRRLAHELREVERAVRDRDALYTALAGHFPSGALALFDAELRYVLVEGSGLADLGMSGPSMVGRTIHEAFSDETARVLEPDHRAAILGQSAARTVERHGRAISLHTVPVVVGRRPYGMVVAQDVTSQKRAERDLERQALTDPLTGLGNRRALDLDLDGELSRSDRHGYPLALVSLDLDGLKQINDRHGHHRGDALLGAFAAALRLHFRAGDRFYRLGGDEFVVVLPHAHGGGQRSILSHVRSAMTRVRRSGFPGVGVSAGVAFYPGEAADAASLLDLADRRMYRQKSEHHAKR